MRDFDKYYKRMEAGMVEKVDYILNYLPADFSGEIVDFGCANGKFIEILKHFLPEATFFGVDNRPEVVKLLKKENIYGRQVQYFNSLEELIKVYDGGFDVIIFSSVLHEVFSFVEKPMEIIQLAKNADIIMMRDMLYTETNQSYEIPHFHDGMGFDWLQFNEDLESPEHIAEFMMKSIYSENWGEELKEWYFSVPYEAIDKYLVGSNFRKAYECNYMNEWLRNKVNQETNRGIDLATFTGTTHTKRIYVKR